jgi:acyl carrier protein
MKETSSDRNILSVEEIQDWLVTQVAQQLGIQTEEIDVQLPFDSYGLDSAKAMSIVAQGEKLLGFKPDPILFWHYPTIESFSERLAEESEAEILEEVDSDILERELNQIENLSDEEAQILLKSEFN